MTQASVKNFQLIQCKKRESIPPLPSSQSVVITSNSSMVSQPLGTPGRRASLAARRKSSLAVNFNVDGDEPEELQTVDREAILNQKRSDDMCMQFGRISDREFTCDIHWPMSILQAFAVALSSFDSKLACE